MDNSKKFLTKINGDTKARSFSPQSHDWMRHSENPQAAFRERIEIRGESKDFKRTEKTARPVKVKAEGS